MSDTKPSIPPPLPMRPSIVDAVDRLVGPLDQILVQLQLSDKRLQQAEVMQRRVTIQQNAALLACLACLVVASIFGIFMISKMNAMTDKIASTTAKLEALRTESAQTREKVEETKQKVVESSAGQSDVELRSVPSPANRPRAVLVIKPKAKPANSALPDLPSPEIQIPVALPQGTKVEEKK